MNGAWRLTRDKRFSLGLSTLLAERSAKQVFAAACSYGSLKWTCSGLCVTYSSYSS